MEDEYFTVKEFAKKLKVGPQSIRRAIQKGRILAFRPGVGKKAPWRISATELGRISVMGFEETVNNVLSYRK